MILDDGLCLHCEQMMNVDAVGGVDVVPYLTYDWNFPPKRNGTMARRSEQCWSNEMIRPDHVQTQCTVLCCATFPICWPYDGHSMASRVPLNWHWSSF